MDPTLPSSEAANTPTLSSDNPLAAVGQPNTQSVSPNLESQPTPPPVDNNPVITPSAASVAPLGPNQSENNLGNSDQSSSAGDGTNKKKVFIVGAVVILMIAVIGGALFAAPKITQQLAKKTQIAQVQPSATPAPVVLPSATVSFLEGEAWIVSGEEKLSLAADSGITQGSTLETGEDTKLVLLFEGGSILRLGPTTIITLDTLTPGDLKILQGSGATYSYVEKNTGRFTVIAGEISIEALGTAFSVEKDEEVAVNVYESSVSIKEGEKEKLEINENKKWTQGSTVATALTTTAISSDNFLQWALEEEIKRIEAEIIAQVAVPENKEDKEAYIAALKEVAGDKKELIKKAFQATTTGTVSAITLTGQVAGDALSLSWTANGLASDGFKIVWSKTPGKPYPGDRRLYNPLYAYAKTLGPMKPGSGTWYFRVCEWTSDACGVYSNELPFTF